MRRQQLKMTLMMLVLTALLLNSTAVWGAAAVPDRVKVGLVYNDNKQTTLNINGYGEIGFGLFSGNGFNEITRFSGIKSVTAAQDYGYHVRVGSAMGDYGSYSSLLQSVRSAAPDACGLYEGGWNVVAGNFLTQTEAEVQAAAIQGQLAGLQCSVIPPSSSRVRVLSGQQVIWMYNSSEADYAFKEMNVSPYLLKINSTAYRGGMIVKRYPNSDLTLINTVTVEEYLYGVVPKEMSAGWPVEALKAQAIAARNYLLTNLGKRAAIGCDLIASPNDQVYGGYSSEGALSNQAVDATKGQILCYNGTPVQAFFHSNSGGSTENSENVWSAAIPYLRGVPDSYSVGAPNTNWSRSYSREELSQLLKTNQYDVGDVQSIAITKKSENGRVLEMAVIGNRGTAKITKETTRKVLGYNDIKSTWFEVAGSGSLKVWDADRLGDLSVASAVVQTASGTSSVSVAGAMARTIDGTAAVSPSSGSSGDSITFTGHGWGHGLGLSQWGAKNMADQGWTYEQILKYYYTGTNIES